MNQWNCSEVAHAFGNNLLIIGYEMWNVFDFSWKIVVLIVQSELKLYDLTVVEAGVEMKLKKFVIRSHNGDIMCLFDRTENRINILSSSLKQGYGSEEH